MTIHDKINKIQADLAKQGITKSRKNAQQGYNFRGIDDVYNALAPLIAKHGVVIVPEYSERETTEKTTKTGGILFYTTIKGKFTFISSEDGTSVEATMYGEAMDSADKSTNKAMSAAYKYACLQVFCIPTEGDNDADATTYDLASKTTVEAPKFQQTTSSATKTQTATADEFLKQIEAAQTDKELSAIWYKYKAVYPEGTQEYKALQAAQWAKHKRLAAEINDCIPY